MDKQKILVTGGAGYIGSHTVVELHDAGYQPVIIDNFSNSEKSVLEGIRGITGEAPVFYEGDCGDAAWLKSVLRAEKNITGVIHFAAYKAVGESTERPLDYYENNVGSLLKLLKVVLESGIPNLVFSSSCTVYGQPDPGGLPVTEDAPRKPAQSPYGNTKKICEDILKDTVMSRAPLKVAALRYFNPIGAHRSALIGELPIGVPNNLVPFITQTAAGVRGRLTIFGDDYGTPDGTCVRDYIHVVDLARAHVLSLRYLDAQHVPCFYDVFNLGTGQGHSVLEVVKTFEQVQGKPLDYIVGKRRPGDVEAVYGSAGKAEKLLGWKAGRSLKDALEDSWRWQQRLAGRAPGK
jgi:UDP-glucose 4-epimerase